MTQGEFFHQSVIASILSHLMSWPLYWYCIGVLFIWFWSKRDTGDLLAGVQLSDHVAIKLPV